MIVTMSFRATGRQLILPARCVLHDRMGSSYLALKKVMSP